MSTLASELVGLGLSLAGLVVINFERLLDRFTWLSDRMPPGTAVPPRHEDLHNFMRTSRGYFVLAIGICLTRIHRLTG